MSFPNVFFYDRVRDGDHVKDASQDTGSPSHQHWLEEGWGNGIKRMVQTVQSIYRVISPVENENYGGNRWVFSRDLKVVRESALRRVSGRELQRVGAAKENDLRPIAVLM